VDQRHAGRFLLEGEERRVSDVIENESQY
jgi:hypothetical protein